MRYITEKTIGTLVFGMGRVMFRLRFNIFTGFSRTMVNTNKELPLGNGWIALGCGMGPTPKLKR